MEFRHMVSFLAIAEELHFGRAAAKLHLTQPSLSLQLQRLERTLGVELVARTSREVRLTPAGRAFEVQARAIVAQMDKAALTAREAAAGRTGTILNSARRCGITLNVAHSLDDPGATAIVVSIKPLVGFTSMSRGLSVGSDGYGVRPVVVQLHDPVPTIDLYAVWRAGDDNPLVGIFLDCIEAAAPFDVPGAVRAARTLIPPRRAG